MSVTTMQLFTPGSLDALFVQSIADAVNAVGGASGLDALTWTVRIENAEIFVLGAPPSHVTEPESLCRQWAQALGLNDCYYDASEDVSSWSRVDGPWLIEISTLVN